MTAACRVDVKIVDDRVLTVGVEDEAAPDAGLVAHAVDAEALWDVNGGALCGYRISRLNMVPGMPWESVHPALRCPACARRAPAAG